MNFVEIGWEHANCIIDWGGMDASGAVPSGERWCMSGLPSKHME